MPADEDLPSGGGEEPAEAEADVWGALAPPVASEVAHGVADQSAAETAPHVTQGAGAPLPPEPAAAAVPPGDSRVASPSSWAPRLDVTVGRAGPPPQLWAVIGLLGLSGVGSLGWSIYWASQALDLFSFGRLGVALGAFVLGLLAIPICFGLGCVYLAQRLKVGDRVARILAVVLCLSAAAAFIFTGSRDLILVLVGVTCLGVDVMLLVDPTTKRHFTGPEAEHGAEPPPVVAARILLTVVGCCILLVGVMFLPLAELDGGLVVYGLLDIGIALTVFWLSRRLSKGDPSARVFVTGLALVYVLLSLLAGHGQPGVILPVGLGVGIVALLWLPETSRAYFASLSRPTQPAVAATERLIEGMIMSLSRGRAS